MTVNTLQSEISNLSDFQDKETGTVGGSSSVNVTKENKITPKTYPDADTACRALSSDEIKAVVYDAPLLKY